MVRGDTTPKVTKDGHNLFDALFGSSLGSKTDQSPSVTHSQFVRGVQDGRGPVHRYEGSVRCPPRGSVHIFLSFFGGPDDRLALEFVVQLCLNPRMTATVVRMVKREGATDVGGSLGEQLERPPTAHVDDKVDTSGPMGLDSRGEGDTVTSTIGSPDTVYGRQTTEMRLQSDTADNIVWSTYASPDTTTPTLRDALSRVHFSDTHTPTPVHAAIRHARTLRETSPRLLVVAGRSRRLAKESHHAEMKRVMETCRSAVGLEVMQKAIGDVGAAMMFSPGPASGVVVVQAAEVGLD